MNLSLVYDNAILREGLVASFQQWLLLSGERGTRQSFHERGARVKREERRTGHETKKETDPRAEQAAL